MIRSRDEIQHHSRTLGVLAAAVFICMVLVLFVEAGALLRAENPGAAALSSLIFRSPVIFYLFAVWKTRRAFGALAKGAMFGEVVPPLLSWIGLTLSAGAFMTVFGVPLLNRMILGSSGLANFDPAAIVLGVVGLMLAILARLLAQAANMRTELDEFF